MIAGALWKYRSTALALTLLIPLLAMNLVSIGYNIWVEDKEDWRSVAGFVAESAHDKPGGLVVFIPGYAELPFDNYFDRCGISVDTQGFPSDETLLHPQPKVVEDIPSWLEGRPYVWLVVRDLETADPDWRVKESLDNNGYNRQEDFVRDDLTVLTYIRWDLASSLMLDSVFPPDSAGDGAVSNGRGMSVVRGANLPELIVIRKISG